MTFIQFRNRDSKNFFRCIVGAILLATCISGCNKKVQSLHELDHVVPAHWPADMRDAANKIRDRVAPQSESQSKANRKELLDLVAWAPEIAADSDLPEVKWVVIYDLSETLRQHLSASDVELHDVQEDLLRLAKLMSDGYAAE